MRKLINLLIIIVIITGTFAILSGCNTEEGGWKVRVANTNLYSDNGYIDYASDVYFYTTTCPDLAEEGLFWTTWDATTETIIQVAADSAEGAALIDPSKPTIINVHGVLADGHYQQERYFLNGKIANPTEFDLDTENVNMNYLWIRAGYNVGNFHYNRHASEVEEAFGITMPQYIEAKIWSTEGTQGVRYRHEDGTYSPKDISEYSLAEHFAAEYIRAMKLLPESIGNEDIRIAAHSMGGEVATSGLFLLTELADAGQISPSLLPDRLALLDSYFGVTIGEDINNLVYMGPKDINIRWSGKNIVDNNTGVMMLECIKDMVANGIAVEYYTNADSFLNIGMMTIINEFKQYVTYTIVFPDFQGEGYTVLMDGHNGIREWYLCSILDSPIKDITNGENSGEFSPSAAMTTAEIIAHKGKDYIIVSGAQTVRADDDTFIRLT